jgi:hypothetical protein
MSRRLANALSDSTDSPKVGALDVFWVIGGGFFRIRDPSGLLAAMLFGVPLGRIGAVVRRVPGMAVGDHRMMGRFFVVAGRMVLGGLAVVLCRVLVMLGRPVVVFRCLLRHGEPSD